MSPNQEEMDERELQRNICMRGHGIDCACDNCIRRRVGERTAQLEMVLDKQMNTETAGGTRFTLGKQGGFWMLPLAGLKYVAKVAEFGSTKYAPFDWALGQSVSSCLNSAWRHLIAAMSLGIFSRDAESKALHLAACVWNLLCILHFHAMDHKTFDDVSPFWMKSTAQIAEQQKSQDPDSPPHKSQQPEQPPTDPAHCSSDSPQP